MEKLIIERFIETLDGLKKTLQEMRGNKDPELKPCPFCGGEIEICEMGNSSFIQCKKCKSGGPFKEDLKVAIEAWNRRV